jgi:hypothetical protein
MAHRLSCSLYGNTFRPLASGATGGRTLTLILTMDETFVFFLKLAKLGLLKD